MTFITNKQMEKTMAELDLDKLERERVLAAEQAVVDNIPKPLLNWLEQANKEFADKGGCPGCGSKLIAVHRLPCSAYEKDPY